MNNFGDNGIMVVGTDVRSPCLPCVPGLLRRPALLRRAVKAHEATEPPTRCRLLVFLAAMRERGVLWQGHPAMRAVQLGCPPNGIMIDAP